MKVVLSSASHHAMLFAYVAKEVIDNFGEKGEQVILDAVHSYGFQRGRRMAMRAQLDGNDCNAVNYHLYREWECFPGQVKCTETRENGSFSLHYSRCPWYTEWEHFGLLEYGKYYCGHVDAALLEGFGIQNGGLKKSRLFGDSTCELSFTGSDCNSNTYAAFEWQKNQLKERSKMPWSYHLGHLYSCFRTSIEEKLGAEGRRALKRAMKNYKTHFGAEACNIVLQYADLDYTQLPDYTPLEQKVGEIRVVDEVMETDVLVAGGSGAAVMAAVEASKAGLDVLMVSKGKIGASGNLIMAGGGFGIDGWSAKYCLGIEEADDSVNGDLFFDSIVKEGFYLNDQDLVELYVKEGPKAVETFLGWAQKKGQEFCFRKNGTWIASGKSFAKALLGGLEEQADIRHMENCVLIEVLTSQNTVTGALILEVFTGRLILVKAKSVVLATGGYQPFSQNNTVSDMTGDGQAIAFRAGASLVDMEFILGMPTALEPEEMKGSIYPFVFEFNMPGLKYQLLNREFQPMKLPEQVTQFRGKKISKFINFYNFSRAKLRGELSDRGGLYLDYSANTQEAKKENLVRFYERFSAWHKKGYYNGESLEKVEKAIMENRPLEVCLGFEYSMGGVEVDSRMQTCVKGLFAAGEITGGTFGACRAGDGIVEMLCQGRQAGQSAADYSLHTGFTAIDEEQLQRQLYHHQRYFEKRSGISPFLLFDQIQRICDEHFGVLRNEVGLKTALNSLLQLRLQLENLCFIQEKERIYNMEWLRAIQCENLLICCEAGIRAALSRRESRGCHIRSDYPEVDHDHFLKKYVFRNEQGHMLMMERLPRTTQIDLPSGVKASVLDYLIDPKLNYRR